MDSSNPTQRNHFNKSIPRLGRLAFFVALSLATATFHRTGNAQEVTLEQSKETPLARSNFFMIPNEDDPRKGFILAVDETIPGGPNFQFCNGEKGSIDLKNLVVSDSGCDGQPVGPFIFANEDLIGSNVFGSKLEYVGKIIDLNEYTFEGDPKVVVERNSITGDTITKATIILDSEYSDFQRTGSGPLSVVIRDSSIIKEFEE